MKKRKAEVRVYFAHNQEVGAVKIGSSGDVNARLDALQIASPHELILMGTLPGGRREEKRLHQLFDAMHMRGEWFRATPELLDDVGRLLAERGTRRTVADELIRRDNCRYGLRDVRVLFVDEPDEAFVVRGSYWGRDHGALKLDLLPPFSPSLQPSTRLEFAVISTAELFARQAPPDLVRGVDASDCILLSRWPIVCPCWLPEKAS